MTQSNLVLIAKRLRTSELGLFDAHRKTGSTRSRQRGLNLDKSFMNLILTPQQQAMGTIPVHVTYRTPLGRVVRESQPRPIKHQSRNWRLTGNRLPEPELQLLTSGDFLLLLFQFENELQLYWEAVRVSEPEPAREALADYLADQVGDKTTALNGEHREIILAQWMAVSPGLFDTASAPDVPRFKQTTLL